MRRFLIDTDTASDDAVALVMALRHPDVAVEAITTVAGNVPVDQGTQNALYTCELVGADVPVHVGCARPLLRDLQTAQDVHGDDGMGDIGLPVRGRTAAPGRAVDVLVDTVLAAPGEITVVALGPLTNLAVALGRAPEWAEAVGRVVVMGGTGRHGHGNVTDMAEYNFWADPEAVEVVLRSGAPLELVGWDVSVTSAVVDETREAALRALGGPLVDFALDIQASLRHFVRDQTKLAGPDMPDPIAMAHALDPGPATTARLPVAIVVGDGPARGAMHVDELGFTGRPDTATVVDDYPADDFFARLHEALAP